MNNKADLKRRIATVKQTRQITGAMETISIAKMRKALEKFDDNHVYFDILCDVMRYIFEHDNGDLEKMITPENAAPKKLVAVIASDKGLCGSFNHDVFKAADAVIDDDTIVMPIGQMAAARYESFGRALDMRFVGAAYSPDYNRARAIASAILDGYGKEYGAVKVVYTRLSSHTVWCPKLLDILPIKRDGIGGEIFEKNSGIPSGMEFEPSPAEVLKNMLPLYVGGLIYGALVHSSAAEHSARRAAMSASTENADEMINALTVEYNRARQGGVTEQIVEIIGSSQALRGRDNE